MDNVIFIDKSIVPSESQLESTLNTTFPYLNKLRDLTKNYSHEWKYYSKKSGWIYKVFSKKKALFYITPLQNTFYIGMAINEAEKETIMQSNICNEIKEKLSSAKKYPEGYPIRLYVQNENDLNTIIQILSILKKI